MTPVTDLAVLLRTLQPVRNPGTYVFAQAPEPNTLAARDIVASVREPEGLSLVVEASVAARHGMQPQWHCAWITLHVRSDLQAVGLTAAFATALGEAGISCNVVAGLHHDHIFVPLPQADQAMATLLALQAAHAAAAAPGRAGP